MNFRMIKYILGWMLLFEACFMLLPAVCALIYRETAVIYFLITMAICAVIGGLLLIRKPKNKTLYSRDGIVIVSMSWILLSAFGALPFFISGEIPSFIDALFESASGFTTTGASIVPNVELLPKSMLLWRSFTHWVGGMGVLVFIMAFLPLSGAHNMHIMKAESPGPSVSKLVPRVRTTAMILYSIYVALTLIQFILLIIAKMSVFDALNTAFATAGTGGFGIRSDSMASYSSAIQIIVTVFMLIFSVNFNSYYLILRGKFKDSFSTEVKCFIGIVVAFIALITLNTVSMYNNTGDAIKHSSFTVASIISTTGFGTVDFNLWPSFSKTLLVLLMFLGGCAGSTCGGIKLSRIIILFKTMLRELRRNVHPKKVENISIDSHSVENSIVRSTASYLICFCLIFIISILLISLDGKDLITNFTAVATTLNNVGPGLEAVGPTQNFAHFSDFSKIVFIFDMLAGRLELFPILLLFSPTTWKQ